MKKRLKSNSLNSKNIWKIALFVVIILVILVLFFVYRNSGKISEKSFTGKVIYNYPLTAEQLAKGVKLDRGFNRFIWTRDFNKTLPITTAFESILDSVIKVYSHRLGKYWYNPRVSNQSSEFSSIQSGDMYTVQLENADNLTLTHFCKDSDGGQNLFVKGNVTWFNASTGLKGIEIDSCLNATKIREYYCLNNHSAPPVYNNRNCPSETNCSDGACRLPITYICNDFYDGGRNYNVSGYYEIKDSNGQVIVSSWEGCYVNGDLYEYYCLSANASSIVTERYNCRNEGKVCQNGACIINFTD